MTRYFLGIDIGATKSHALIADDTGQAVGWGQSGPGNYESVGIDGYHAALQTATGDALQNAGLTIDQIAGAGFGIGGYDWPHELSVMEKGIHTLGLDAPFTVVNDVVLSLVAGAARGWGVVIGAGTSCNCRGRDAAGNEGRIVGNGPPFGEYGGGYELVYKSIEAVSRAWSLRGPATALARIFVDQVGAADVTDLLAGLSTNRYELGADAAPLIFAAAAAGDAVALDTISWISRELGGLGIGVIRQLKLEAAAFDVVLAGSFYKGSPIIVEQIKATILPVAPAAEFVMLTAPPVVGGVLLAMEQVGVDFTSLRPQLIASAQALISPGE